ncbi:MAG: glycosyltransferase family 4 protein [Pseudomonadota bacterium]
MKVLIITTSCNPFGGGFPLRVHSLAQMCSQIAQVSVLSTFDPDVPAIAGVKFHHRLFPEGLSSRIKRLTSYYRTSFKPIGIDEQPDIIQVEHPSLFALAAQFPGVPVVLDEHNVYWKLAEYEMHRGPTLRRVPLKKTLKGWLLSRATKYELAALNRSSHVIVCSTADRDIILGKLPQLKGRISYIPNCLDIDRYQTSSNDGRIVLFMGSLIYFPNIDAVRIICEDIAPRVNAEFHILGGGSLNMPAPPNVKFLGRVEDVRPYVQKARVCIAPLRYGSGSRLKILEYMAMGKATVSSSKGAEGLDVVHGENIIIEDDFNKFAGSIAGLLEDNRLCGNIGAQARRLIEEKYDYRLYCETLKAIYLKASREKVGCQVRS